MGVFEKRETCLVLYRHSKPLFFFFFFFFSDWLSLPHPEGKRGVHIPAVQRLIGTSLAILLTLTIMGCTIQFLGKSDEISSCEGAGVLLILTSLVNYPY